MKSLIFVVLLLSSFGIDSSDFLLSNRDYVYSSYALEYSIPECFSPSANYMNESTCIYKAAGMDRSYELCFEKLKYFETTKPWPYLCVGKASGYAGDYEACSEYFGNEEDKLNICRTFTAIYIRDPVEGVEFCREYLSSSGGCIENIAEKFQDPEICESLSSDHLAQCKWRATYLSNKTAAEIYNAQANLEYDQENAPFFVYQSLILLNTAFIKEDYKIIYSGTNTTLGIPREYFALLLHKGNEYFSAVCNEQFKKEYESTIPDLSACTVSMSIYDSDGTAGTVLCESGECTLVDHYFLMRPPCMEGLVHSNLGTHEDMTASVAGDIDLDGKTCRNVTYTLSTDNAKTFTKCIDLDLSLPLVNEIKDDYSTDRKTLVYLSELNVDEFEQLINEVLDNSDTKILVPPFEGYPNDNIFWHGNSWSVKNT